MNSVSTHTARFHRAVGDLHLNNPMPAPWNTGSDMQANVRRQKGLAAARPAEHRPYAMSRDDALDQPQTIQHRAVCGVSGFPPEAITTVVMSMPVRFANSVGRLALPREVAPPVYGGADIVRSKVTSHCRMP